ncbi:MAG: protein-glutamate O-methyltransferase CheR [Sphingobium sp.]|nr:protein-glutamate O-methyltransferase CheR [Sphingobium sp.]
MIHEGAEQFTAFPGVSEQVYSRRDFEAIRQMIYSQAGIVLPPGKSTLVYSRIAPLVRESNAGTFSAYIQRIQNDPVEARKAVCALTTNHTFFWREPHHFEYFREHVRPGLIQKLAQGGPVRIWSAGSSSGEEVYSLVMTLLGTDPREARMIMGADIAILASDLADHALVKAKGAQYDADAVEPLPADLRSKWVKVSGGVATIVPEAANMVSFRTLNLLGQWPLKRKFDVIFCRNVMIYFDQPTRERLISRYTDQLVSHGHLFIGHSERVSGPAEAQLDLVNLTTYRKNH